MTEITSSSIFSLFCGENFWGSESSVFLSLLLGGVLVYQYTNTLLFNQLCVTTLCYCYIPYGT